MTTRLPISVAASTPKIKYQPTSRCVQFLPGGVSLSKRNTMCLRGVSEAMHQLRAGQPSRNKHSESLQMLFCSGGIYRMEVSSEILFKCVSLLPRSYKPDIQTTDTSLMQAVAGWLMYSKASRLSEVNKPK